MAGPQLVLLRHAKSDWTTGAPDHERPLAARGRRDALAAGRLLAAHGPLLKLVLCSTAQRTRQTWEIAASELRVQPEVRFEPELYGGMPADVLRLLRTVPAKTGSVLVIGHEPTMSGVAELLAGSGSDPAALATVERKFPTAGVAVLTLHGDWPQLDASGADLLRFNAPRG